MSETKRTFRALPDEAPMRMEPQSLTELPNRHGRPRRPLTAPSFMLLRRAAVIGGAFVLTAFGGYEMNLVLNANGVSTLGLIVLGLFLVLFCWIALSFVSAIFGFVSVLRHGGLGLGITRDGPMPELTERTAVLMPTYNESPGRVMAGLRAIYESIEATGRIEAFHFFILSDTTNPDVWVQEEAAFLALRDQTGGHDRIFYRRRAKNTERKSGNLMEWVRRFGAAYPHMLTLDADSVMDGGIIVRITDAMERNPGVALIQTLPAIVNGTTLFARLQQFAGRVYGPLIAHGIAWWHGSEGNYWGHNAVIRTRAFAEQAGLPHLPGRKPFGGHILSHDFVEAALMRRGGWAIHMVPGLIGSYEESPPSLTDVAIRDRRWCQGNLQHYKVLSGRGLHPISRLHMLMGIGSYITSPLWLVFLLAGILISLQARFIRPEYFGETKLLYPHWPQVDPIQAKAVFIGTMFALLAPKLMAFVALLLDRATMRQCGGAARVLISIVVETVVGGLIAPIAMLIQTSGVVSILAGQDSGWNAQRRDDGGIPLGEVVRGYWRYMVMGLLMALAAWIVSTPLFLWMTPVLVGLALAIPLAASTASRAIGQWLFHLGLLLIPEETAPPDVLVRARAALMAMHRFQLDAEDGLTILKSDDTLRAAHIAMLPPPRRPGDAINADLLVGELKLSEAASVQSAAAAMSRAEKAAVLGNAACVEHLTGLTA